MHMRTTKSKSAGRVHGLPMADETAKRRKLVGLVFVTCLITSENALEHGASCRGDICANSARARSGTVVTGAAGGKSREKFAGAREDVMRSEIVGDTLFQLYDPLGDNSVLCASHMCFVWAGYSMEHVRAEARLPGVGSGPPTTPGPTIYLKMWHSESNSDTLVSTDAPGYGMGPPDMTYVYKETVGSVYSSQLPGTVALDLWYSASLKDHMTISAAVSADTGAQADPGAVAALAQNGYKRIGTIGFAWPAPGAAKSHSIALNHDGKLRSISFQRGDNLTQIAEQFIETHNLNAAACCVENDLGCVSYTLRRAMELQLQPFMSWRHSPIEVTHRWRRAVRSLEPVPVGRAHSAKGANSTGAEIAPGTLRYDGDLAAWYRARGDNTLRHQYMLGAGSTVFIVGGHNGSFARTVFDTCERACDIYVFEPVPEFAQAAAHGLARVSEDKRWPGSIRVLPIGLSDTAGTVDFVFEGVSTSQFLPEKTPATAGASVGGKMRSRRVLSAQVQTLAGAMHELDVHHIDLLMVNCEGCEYKLLPNVIRSGLLPHIDNLQIQFHCRDDMGFTGREQLLRLYSLLVPTHELSWNFTCIWENWQRV